MCLEAERGPRIAHGLVPVSEQPACISENCWHAEVGLISKTEYHLAAPGAPTFAKDRCSVTFYMYDQFGHVGVEVYAPSKDELTEEQWRAAAFHQATVAAEKAAQEKKKPTSYKPLGKFRLRWLLLSLWQRFVVFTRPWRWRLGLVPAKERKQVIEALKQEWIAEGGSPEVARRIFPD